MAAGLRHRTGNWNWNKARIDNLYQHVCIKKRGLGRVFIETYKAPYSILALLRSSSWYLARLCCVRC